jgi:hypothetical protein
MSGTRNIRIQNFRPQNVWKCLIWLGLPNRTLLNVLYPVSLSGVLRPGVMYPDYVSRMSCSPDVMYPDLMYPNVPYPDILYPDIMWVYPSYHPNKHPSFHLIHPSVHSNNFLNPRVPVRQGRVYNPRYVKKNTEAHIPNPYPSIYSSTHLFIHQCNASTVDNPSV